MENKEYSHFITIAGRICSSVRTIEDHSIGRIKTKFNVLTDPTYSGTIVPIEHSTSILFPITKLKENDHIKTTGQLFCFFEGSKATCYVEVEGSIQVIRDNEE